MPTSVNLSRGTLKRQATDALGLERLVDRHRAVDERRPWRHKRDLDTLTSLGTQRQERLQPGDATARDDDPRPG
jgi:hypothetical protein